MEWEDGREGWKGRMEGKDGREGWMEWKDGIDTFDYITSRQSRRSSSRVVRITVCVS